MTRPRSVDLFARLPLPAAGANCFRSLSSPPSFLLSPRAVVTNRVVVVVVVPPTRAHRAAGEVLQGTPPPAARWRRRSHAARGHPRRPPARRQRAPLSSCLRRPRSANALRPVGGQCCSRRRSLAVHCSGH